MLWPLVLGFTLSAAVQAVVSHRTLARLLGNDSPRSLALATLLVQRPEDYTDEQVAYLAQLGECDAAIATAHRLTQDFLCMVRQRQGKRLDAWIKAAASEIAEMRRFALGLQSDAGSGPCWTDASGEQWANRGPDQPTQTGEAGDVRAGEV